MKKLSMSISFIVFLFLISLSFGHILKPSSQEPSVPGQCSSTLCLNPDLQEIPLYFIPNLGQEDPAAVYYAKTHSYTLWLTAEGIVFDSLKSQGENATRERDVSKLVFIGARKNPELKALNPADYHVNYFFGKEAGRWITDIPSCLAVLYEDVYENIDLKVYGMAKEIEYDWIVRPGGKIEDIRFAYRNVESASIDLDGHLHIHTRLGDLIHKKPDCRQTINSQPVEVTGGFREIGQGIFSFEVGPYDPDADLVIDPVVVPFSTFLGGSQWEEGKGISIDAEGAIYVAGSTESSNFPGKIPFDPAFNGDADAYLTKFNPGGKTLAYSTYFGGSQEDYGDGIQIDSQGCAIIIGETKSLDFPATGLDTTLGGKMDGYVAKFSAAGNVLVYSTFLGGGDEDSAKDVAVDTLGNAFVTGWTGSKNFPVKKGYDMGFNGGNRDAFLCKLSPDGKSMVYSTYLGGNEEDYAYVVAVDKFGSAYLTGHTHSKNFPLKKAFDRTRGGRADSYITKFAPTGKSLVFSTYLGGEKEDWGYGIAVDDLKSVYVTGSTESSGFPVKNAFDDSFNGGDEDVFLVKLIPAGNALAYSTYLGGSRQEASNDIAVGVSGLVYITGHTDSSNFPVWKAFDPTLNGNDDIFVTAFESSGENLVFSTFIGGKNWDNATDIAVNKNDHVFIVGHSESPNFPKKKPYDGTYGGRQDAVIVEFDLR